MKKQVFFLIYVGQNTLKELHLTHKNSSFFYLLYSLNHKAP